MTQSIGVSSYSCLTGWIFQLPAAKEMVLWKVKPWEVLECWDPCFCSFELVGTQEDIFGLEGLKILICDFVLCRNVKVKSVK